MQNYQENLAARVNGILQPLLGVSVTVTAANGQPAALYKDDAVTPLPQPLTTDDSGYFGFFAPNGRYTLTFSGAQIQTASRSIELYDADDVPPVTQQQLAAASGAGMIGYGAQTVAQALGGKAPLDSPSFTGNFAKVSNGTSTGYLGAGSALVSGGANSDFSVRSDANLTFAAGGATERARIDAAGNLLAGVTSGSYHNLRRATNVDAGDAILEVSRQQTGLPAIICYGVSQALYSSANAAVKTGRDGVTSRSINAGGTINASGADYAEYMTKAEDCGVITAGQIVGVSAAGLLTDKWADAVSFLIKSTDPSYVGGDTWGSEEALGVARPAEPVFEGPDYTGSAKPANLAEGQASWGERDDALAQYEADQQAHAEDVATAQRQFDSVTMPAYRAALANFEAKLEAARQRVDRIAYCGQVPVNVLGAQPGQYVVPVQAGGGIGGQLVSDADITFAQYRRAVGIVQNILPDGRANVRVKPV